MLVQHHVKYEEIHGVDEIVMMDRVEHTSLHKRLRNEKKIKVTSKDLIPISHAAYRRTTKGKCVEKKRTKNSFNFCEDVDIDICLFERLRYSESSGNVSVHSNFKGSKGKKIVWVDI